jgi:hypothetical protein
MKTYRFITLGVLFVLLVSLVGIAWARSAQTYSLERQVIGSGRVHLGQGGSSLHNTLGQPVVGSYSDAADALCVGFLCVAAVQYDVFIPVVLKNV